MCVSVNVQASKDSVAAKESQKAVDAEEKKEKTEAPKTQKEKLLAHAVESGAVVPWLQKMVRWRRLNTIFLSDRT